MQQEARRLQRHLPDASIVRLEGSGHISLDARVNVTDILMRHPKLFAQVLPPSLPPSLPRPSSASYLFPAFYFVPPSDSPCIRVDSSAFPVRIWETSSGIKPSLPPSHLPSLLHALQPKTQREKDYVRDFIKPSPQYIER
jgi:hypothetical protein